MGVTHPSRMSVQELLGKTFPCVCGREHPISTSYVDFEKGAMARLMQRLPARVHIVMDENTRRVSEGYPLPEGAGVTRTVLTGGELHADADALGTVLADLPMDCEALLAVGSGTVNDITRFVASRVKLPYSIAATAPSMDGYASAISPLLLGGVKQTFEAVAPTNIVGEPDILAAAPSAMIAAGAGDLYAKIASAAEWRMARDVDDEPYCPELVAMVDHAVEEALAAAPGLAARDPKAVAQLTEALVISGLAMQMQRSSRPASGMEHHISHFWEMALIASGRNPGLHGDKVGIGTLVAMDMYPRFFGKPRTPKRDSLHARRLLENWEAVRAEAEALAARRAEVEAAITLMGGPVHPRQVGIDRDGFLDTLLHCKDVRPRYSLFNVLDEFDMMEEMARETVAAWYD